MEDAKKEAKVSGQVDSGVMFCDHLLKLVKEAGALPKTDDEMYEGGFTDAISFFRRAALRMKPREDGQKT